MIDARNQWKNHVQSQLAVGGGSLFKFIASQDKTHLNVSLQQMKGDNCCTEQFFQGHLETWSNLWNPKNTTPDEVNELIKEVKKESYEELANKF